MSQRRCVFGDFLALKLFKFSCNGLITKNDAFSGTSANSAAKSIMPIFGATKPSHLTEDLSAVQFSESEIHEINALVDKGSIHGDRLIEAARPLYHTD